MSRNPKGKTEKGEEKEYYGSDARAVESTERMPMSTAGQRELAIHRFPVAVLLWLGGVIVGMRVGMGFLEMLFKIGVLMVPRVLGRRVRMGVRMNVGGSRLRMLRMEKRNRRPCEVHMDMGVVAPRVIVVERADLWKAKKCQEDSQQDDNAPPGAALPCSPESHAVFHTPRSILRNSLSLWM